jgi:hypothetical protein
MTTLGTPVILATQKQENLEASWAKLLRPYLKTKYKSKTTRGMAQVVDHLPTVLDRPWDFSTVLQKNNNKQTSKQPPPQLQQAKSLHSETPSGTFAQFF